MYGRAKLTRRRLEGVASLIGIVAAVTLALGATASGSSDNNSRSARLPRELNPRRSRRTLVPCGRPVRTSVGPSRSTSRGFPAGHAERFETKGPCSKPRIAHGPVVVYPPPIRVVTPGR
jgi:hypothetical protein